jgi:hypothetical protein
MFHRDTSRKGLRTFRLIAIATFSAMAGSSNSGWAFGVGALPQNKHIIYVAEQTSSTPTAQKTLNHICQAANLPHVPPVHWFVGSILSPTDAQNTLLAIQSMSKTQKSLCPPSGTPSPRALNTVENIGKKGVPPVYDPHHNFSSSIIRINELYGQFKAMETMPQ